MENLIKKFQPTEVIEFASVKLSNLNLDLYFYSDEDDDGGEGILTSSPLADDLLIESKVIEEFEILSAEIIQEKEEPPYWIVSLKVKQKWLISLYDEGEEVDQEKISEEGFYLVEIKVVNQKLEIVDIEWQDGALN